MNSAHWLMVGLLAIAAFSIRVAGLVAGTRIRTSYHAWILEELPGLIVISLVASSLVGQSLPTWIAAIVAFGVAVITNHVIITMALSVVAFAGMEWLRML